MKTCNGNILSTSLNLLPILIRINLKAEMNWVLYLQIYN